MKKKYEYRVADWPAFDWERPIADFLNYMGSRGWELVSVSEPIVYCDSDTKKPIENPTNKDFMQRLVFKKEIRD